MKKIMDIIERKMISVTSKLSHYIWLRSLKSIMASMVPFLIVGSIYVLIMNFPSENWAKIMENVLGEGWKEPFLSISDSTFGLMGLFLLVGMTYNYGKELNQDVGMMLFLALSSVFVLTPVTDGTITIEWFSSKGMLVNIVLSILLVLLYARINQIELKFKKGESIPPGVLRSLQPLIPISIILSLLMIIRTILNQNQTTLYQLLYSIIQEPLLKLGNTLPAILLAELLGQILWFF